MKEFWKGVANNHRHPLAVQELDIGNQFHVAQIKAAAQKSKERYVMFKEY